MQDKYDVICIGAGPAGYSAALSLAKAKKKVALIDKSFIQAGGTCLNEGCIPVKSLIKVSKFHYEANKAGKDYGLNIHSQKPDYKEIVSYTKKVSDTLKKGLIFLFKSQNIDFIEGEAKLIGNKEVKINNSQGEICLKADNIILATGSIARQIPGLEFNGKNIVSSKQALELEILPERILIIGGGAIGIEFACVFSNLGSEVKLVELQDHILPEEDKDAALALTSLLKKQGINVYTNASASIDSKKNVVCGQIKKDSGQESFEADLVLVSVGRAANIDTSLLDKLGISTDKGKVVVDKKMQTSLKGVYAIGDITCYPMLAHSAYKQASIAVKSILSEAAEEIDVKLIPNVVYSNYEFARVGLKEEEAQEQKIDYKINKYQMRACGRAVASNYPQGFIKVIYEAKTKKILGATLLSHDASELIHQFLIAVDKELSLDDIKELIYAHPTFSEAIHAACSD
jgi:dihydrolipoamide dehydrogenase